MDLKTFDKVTNLLKSGHTPWHDVHAIHEVTPSEKFANYSVVSWSRRVAARCRRLIRKRWAAAG